MVLLLQVQVVLHAAGAPSNTRSLSLTRQKVAINPVAHATCTGVPAAALPAGEDSSNTASAACCCLCQGHHWQ
jgi:hypothetical protein